MYINEHFKAMNHKINETLIKSAERAMDNIIPDSLISASIELKVWKHKWLGIFVGKEKKEIQWLCVFDSWATEDDIEFGGIAGTEIISDFNSEYGLNEMFEKISSNEKPRVLKHIIYSRKN